MKTLFLMMIISPAFITVAKADLAADIADHNARCANVQAGTPEAAQCDQEQAALNQRSS
jgi:hypothetical protein